MIVIAMDSTAYVTRQEAKDLGVIYIPMTYSIDEKVYQETFIRDNARFNNAALAKVGTVHTSQPVMSSLSRRFGRVVGAGYDVLCLTISSRLSGTYSNAAVCAKEFAGRVRVIDSRTSAAGMYLLAKAAKALIDRGLSLDEIAARITAFRGKIEARFTVSDLAPLRRSGRLGFVRQSVGTILNQRPILSMNDGAVVCVGVVRGSKEQMKRLIDEVPLSSNETVVEYFLEKETAEAIAQKLREKGVKNVQVRRIGIVLGVHLGFDVVGVVWQNE